MQPLKAHLELEPTAKDFASGLLLDLIDALRRTSPGELIAITTAANGAAEDLNRWSRLTGNSIVQALPQDDATRFVIRNGPAPDSDEIPSRRLQDRLWLYTNFDCNLACDYCCVRSTPHAPRNALGLERTQRIAAEAAELGVQEIFLTGGEPFLLSDLDAIAMACAAVARTTILTNAMMFRGKRLETLRRMPRDSVVLQVSLDSPASPLHDLHRGGGSWQKAWQGIELARSEGFRVRLAATVPDEAAALAFSEFLDREDVAPEDRLIRRVAMRGFAESGVALSRADLVPEVTITTTGVYWHPVGAADDDLLITRQIFPLRDAYLAVERALAEENQLSDRLASVFHCA